MQIWLIFMGILKNFNRQVKNNIERFDDDFRFQLTDTEVENLRCNFCTSSWGGVRYNPYAFTELGIYTLMTVLKGELAVNQSKKLLRLFKKLKDFAIQMQNVLPSTEMQILAIQTQNNKKAKYEMIFHCGGSSKDSGKKVTSISKVEDVMLYHNIISSLQGNPLLYL